MPKKCKHGRHTPAFILLFLAEDPSYGLDLLKKMDLLLPCNKIDSAAIYRSLKDLEKEELVVSEWDTSNSGPAKKYYKITEEGLKELSKFKQDIEVKLQNLNFFLYKYKDLRTKGVGLSE